MTQHFRTIGSSPDSADPAVRVEVSLSLPRRLPGLPIIYVTKYSGRAVGEHSVGLHPEIALAVADMLRTAVSLAQEPPVDKLMKTP